MSRCKSFIISHDKIILGGVRTAREKAEEDVMARTFCIGAWTI